MLEKQIKYNYSKCGTAEQIIPEIVLAIAWFAMVGW
jgi:hypothetical protein